MGFITNPFSVPDLFEHLRVEGGISAPISPLRFSSPLHAKLFNIMTCEEHDTELNTIELHGVAILLTSDSDYFLAIITNKFGSKRMQKLLGKEDDVDALFCGAIQRSFLQIMTDEYASHVAVQAIVVINKNMKITMYEHILFNALQILCDQHGCSALINIIIDMDDDDEDYTYKILGFITRNTLILSKHESGNYMVQHVLEMDYLQCTDNIVNNLTGHFVEFSFNKYGSYVVGKILETETKWMSVVVMELLECRKDRLIRLARNEFGNEVVCKALRLTRQRSEIKLFVYLVEKLIPFLHLLRTPHATNIANILDSFKQDLCS